MGCDGALYAFSLFIPTIIQQMGYQSTRAQLLSVPPYAVAAVVTITVGYVADRTGKRGKINHIRGAGLSDVLKATVTWSCHYSASLALPCYWVLEIHTFSMLEPSWGLWESTLVSRTPFRTLTSSLVSSMTDPQQLDGQQCRRRIQARNHTWICVRAFLPVQAKSHFSYSPLPQVLSQTAANIRSIGWGNLNGKSTSSDLPMFPFALH